VIGNDLSKIVSCDKKNINCLICEADEYEKLIFNSLQDFLKLASFPWISFMVINIQSFQDYQNSRKFS
jgi:hypothetical protein